METTPQQLGSIGQVLTTAAKFIDRLGFYVMVTSMISMAIIVSAQVIARYFFQFSIAWSEELARLLFISCIFLAIPHGVRLGSHVGIDVVTRLIPEKLRNIIARLMNLLCAVLCVIIFVMGISVIRINTGALMMTINLTANMYYFPVVFAMFHAFIHFIILAVYGPVMREKKL